MGLFVLGTSQSVASAREREMLHVDLEELYDAFGPLRERGILEEGIPLATCGRLELYAVSDDPERALRVLRTLLARRAGTSVAALVERSYVHREDQAVRHVFRVAAGLDSVVHGEAQIIGQVRDALEHPRTSESAGPVLHRLFQHALAAGKRVRTETEIGRGAVSLAGAALALLKHRVGSLAPLSAAVLGAGDTGTLMARLLRKEGIGGLTVANRSPEKAERVARELGGAAAALTDLGTLLADADVIVGAVGERDDLVTPAVLARAMEGASPRERYFLDLAHPRNFHPDLAQLPGVHLVDLEEVFRGVEAAREARAGQIPMAEAIVSEDTDAFMKWLRARPSVAVLRAVREQVLEMARAEAERYGRGRSEEEREELHRLARSLARAVLDAPTRTLREADPTRDEGRHLLESATSLFGVSPLDLEAAGS
ncbi:MAG: glutamyl-tRNA reductase [Gemmatimonadota bacterium]|jgi:glutamyl-tRNA reductase